MDRDSVYLDRSRCKGCGACEEVAPDAFEMDDSEDLPIIKDLDGCSEEDLKQAILVCPANCIEADIDLDE